MQDSIQSRPVMPAGGPSRRDSRIDESGIPVIPSNAEELVGRTTLHQPTPEAPAKSKSVAPAVKSALPKHIEVPRLLAWPPVNVARVDSTGAMVTLPVDSLAVDSLLQPALPVEGEIKEGIILVNPAAGYRVKDKEARPERSVWGGGMSWIYLGLIILFCFTAVKFKGNTKYLKALLTDLTDTRVRHNMFDDTVKETSLLVLMNLTWVASVGILLWILVTIIPGNNPASSLGIPDVQAKGILLCCGVVGVYQILIFLAYTVVGNVFSDTKLTRLWLKGAGASCALETFILFPLALLALNYPAWEKGLLIAAAAVFVIGKLVFLYKGFRIFFNQISSWLLFLYYLCSLEIVPLILTYVATVAVCATWL